MSTWVTGTTVVENSVDTENLTSNVTITLICGWNGGSWASDNPYYYINVNGSRVKSGNANFNTGQASSGSQTIATWTGDVPHESDGTGSMTWAVGYEGIYAGEGIYSTASGTKTLTPIEIPDPDPPTPTGDGNYLDKTGLAYFFGKLKAMFANKDEVVTSVNGQTGDVIVEGGEGGGTSNNLVTLWTNPSPTSAFNAQTITLSQSATDFDALLVYCQYNPTQNTTNGISIASTSGITRLIAAQGTTGTAIGMRTMTVNGTSVTFTTGQYNGASSEGTTTQVCVPEKICGLRIKGVGESSQLELIWTNPNPTSAFAQQTVALDLTPYDAVVIEANTSTNTTTGRTMQFGLVGSSVRLMAEIYQIHRRLATIASDGITFGNNYYLPTYATGSESEANTYLIPTRIYGLRVVKPNYYHGGDTYTVVAGATGEITAYIAGGFMTDSSKRMYFTVHLPYSMANVTPSITSLRMNVRHVGGGYATSSSYVSGGLQVVGVSGYTVNCTKINDYDLTIGITHTSFNGTSNTPVGLEVDELIISFS